MDKLVFSCFLLGGLTPDPGPTDSCALNAYCAAGLTNVGCNPPPVTGGPACDGKSVEVLELLSADQTSILSYLNEKRDLHGSGGFGNDPANRMFALQWDENLATQAGHNARSCTIARDACRNTADYHNVGQLIVDYTAMVGYLESMSKANKINYVLGARLSFYVFYSGAASFSSYSASTYTENEANILNDRSTKVGCALMQWTAEGQITVYLVCNFSANVIEGQPVYTPAATAGMGCTTRDTTYPNLCLS